MKPQTFSIVVGGSNCNLNCPYCVSKMTGQTKGCTNKVSDINERNFHKACQFAKQSGVSTVLLTGKGEPTMYLDHITRYLHMLNEYHFPFIEIQTNGINLQVYEKQVKEWYDMGVTIVSLSCMHWSEKINQDILGKHFVGLRQNIELLHKHGFSVRTSCVMLKGFIDSPDTIRYFIQEIGDNTGSKVGPEQMTFRPVGLPDKSSPESIHQRLWARKHYLTKSQEKEIEQFFDNIATLLLKLAHGAKVYDYQGQNISLNTCLTESSDPEDIRQIIFFPDGHLRFSWVYLGAIIF